MQHLSARKMIQAVMQPFTDLAVELMVKMKHKKNAPNSRFQIAAIIIFLAGVEKALGLTLQFLYINGYVDWKWIKPINPKAGGIGCGPGVSQKIHKLKELGLNLSSLRDLIDIRNEYIHHASIDVLYKVSFTNSESTHAEVRPIGPEIAYYNRPLMAITTRNLRSMSTRLISTLSKFLEEKKWRVGVHRLMKNVKTLPINPNGINEKIVEGVEYTELLALLEKFNRDFIGEGLSKLL